MKKIDYKKEYLFLNDLMKKSTYLQFKSADDVMDVIEKRMRRAKAERIKKQKRAKK